MQPTPTAFVRAVRAALTNTLRSRKNQPRQHRQLLAPLVDVSKIIGRVVARGEAMMKSLKFLMLGAVLMASCSTDVGTSSNALNLTPTIGTFALYAARSVKLGNQDQIKGGDIGIAASAPLSFGSQLVVGNQTQISHANNILAPSVMLGAQSQVGDVQTNTLINDGAQSLGTVAAYPSSMPLLPLAVSPVASAANVVIAAQAHVTLSPGVYGTLTVGNQAHVVLSAGAYSFSQVSLGNQVQVIGNSTGVTVSVSGTFATGSEVQINRSGAATKFAIMVGGNDVASTPAVVIGQQSQLTTLFTAPYGTMSVAAQAQMIGAFVAFDISLANQVQVTYQSGFSIPTGPPTTQVVAGNAVPAAIASAPILGTLPAATILNIGLELPLQNASTLASLLQGLYDPTSPQYQQFLTPAAFNAQFSSASLYQQLVAWAQSESLQTTTFANNRFLVVTGSIAQLEGVFGVTFNLYSYASGGQFFAPDRTPTIPLSVPALFNGVGFNDFNTPSGGPVPTASLSSGSGPNGTFYGPDFRNLYATGTSLDGTGQTLALVEFDDFLDQDIVDYANVGASPLTIPPINRVPVMGGSGVSGTSEGAEEVALDIDMAVAMAPGLKSLLVFEGPSGVHHNPTPPPINILDQTTYDLSAAAIFNDLQTPPVGVPLADEISCSWSGFDGTGVVQALVAMSAQHQSVFISSGDDGAYVASNPLLPPSLYPAAPLPRDPLDSRGSVLGSSGLPCIGDFIPTTCVAAVNFMTVVGGTQATPPAIGTPNTGCLTETVWNDGNTANESGVNNGPGGGGICPNVFGASFQPPALMTVANGFGANASTTNRNIPDVAALATGIWIVLDGTGRVSGGTSAAAPLWAAFMALINQQRLGLGLSDVGFANPILYAVGQGAHYDADFLDIVGGTINPNLTDAAHWSAVQGYDLASGWGSPRIGLIADVGAGAPPIPAYTSASVNILTGDDDLRCTSEVSMEFLGPFQAPIIDTITLHSAGDTGVHEHFSLSVTASLFNSLELTQVAFVRLNFHQTSNACNLFSTSDNWDIAAMQVQLVPTVGAPVTIFDETSFDPQLRLMDDGTGDWSVTFPTQNTLACPVTCASGSSCAKQTDCAAGTGTCLGSTGAIGSGCCTVPSTVCDSDADCPAGTTCFTGSGTPGACI